MLRWIVRDGEKVLQMAVEVRNFKPPEGVQIYVVPKEWQDVPTVTEGEEE